MYGAFLVFFSWLSTELHWFLSSLIPPLTANFLHPLFNLFLKVLLNRRMLVLVSCSHFISCYFSCNYKAYCIPSNFHLPSLTFCGYFVPSPGIILLFFSISLSSVLSQAVRNLGWGTVEQSLGQLPGESTETDTAWVYIMTQGSCQFILFLPVSAPLPAPSKVSPQCLQVVQERDNKHCLQHQWCMIGLRGPWFS